LWQSGCGCSRQTIDLFYFIFYLFSVKLWVLPADNCLHSVEDAKAGDDIKRTYHRQAIIDLFCFGMGLVFLFVVCGLRENTRTYCRQANFLKSLVCSGIFQYMY